MAAELDRRLYVEGTLVMVYIQTAAVTLTHRFAGLKRRPGRAAVLVIVACI